MKYISVLILPFVYKKKNRDNFFISVLIYNLLSERGDLWLMGCLLIKKPR